MKRFGSPLRALVGLSMLLMAANAANAAPTFSVTRSSALDGDVVTGDFTGDGIPDLAGRARVTSGTDRPVVIVLPGRGDGTFGAPIRSTTPANVYAAADFNGDGKLDLLVQLLPQPDEDVVVLPGNGNGTFGSEQRVTTTYRSSFALAADFDGDGRPDVALEEELEDEAGSLRLSLFRNTGGFAFASMGGLALPPEPTSGIVADVDGDGRRDLLVSNFEEFSVTVFRNLGNFTFLTETVATGYGVSGLAVADVDGDGTRDLLFTHTTGSGYPYSEGYVSVAPGNGDGTFGTPVAYQVGRGAWRVVVADVTRDGIPDIVTANRSSIYRDDCGGNTLKTWDSLSVLPGLGGGAFDAPHNFSIGNQLNVDSDRDRNTVSSLVAADVTGDGASDLIASGGTVFVNRPSDPNWAPTVDLGPDQTLNYVSDIILRAPASDVDQDMLTYSWTTDAGISIPPIPRPCIGVGRYGTYHFTVTVDDGHGHRTSDSMTLTLADPSSPWTDGDIGAVGAAGSASSDGSVITVRGSGADIWGTADEFHFVHQPVETSTSTLEILTRVDSVQNVNPWTKAGVMLRSTLEPGSVHASLFVSPGKGIAFQRRTTPGGESVHTAGPLLTAPVWLRLTLNGTLLCDEAICEQATIVRAYYRRNATDGWTSVGEERFPGYPEQFAYAGLAVTSHADGAVATATFSQVAVRPLPAWAFELVGGATGWAEPYEDTITIASRGADIWGVADAFTYIYDQAGHVPAHASNPVAQTMTARVSRLTNTNAWAKAGVMFRDDLESDSPHVMVIVSPGKGVAMQYRAARGGESAQVAQVTSVAPPAWVRLTQSGTTFTGSYSTNGVTWHTLGSITLTLRAQRYAGLAVTSHTTAAEATAVFDSVAFEP